MIPIGDDRLRNAPTPWVNWLFILINIAVFIYQMRMEPLQMDDFVTEYGAVPADILSGQHLRNLFTSMFMHGGWMHIIGNMLFLWVFGDNIEAALGHVGYIFYYIIGGLVAALSHVFSDPNSILPMVGASGAISACLGSYLIMYPSSKVRTLIILGFYFTTIRVSAWLFLGFWIVIQLVSGLVVTTPADAATGGTAWWAHIGGFAYGLFTGIIFRSKARNFIIPRA